MSINDLARKYEEATNEFLSVVASLTPGDLDKSDSEGWTPRQVIHHMADSESQSNARLRRILSEPAGTQIQGYDENLWANNKTLGYSELPIDTALAMFKASRASTLETIKRMTEDQLQIAGVHSESGPYTVAKWFESYSKHPVDHANQIRGCLN
jgi:DinB superfamily